MSKNTSSSDFRKIDVDRFDEDNFQDEAVTGNDGANVDAIASSIRELLNSKNNEEALKKCVESPPTAADEQTKAKMCDVVMQTLASFKADAISGAVSALSPVELDTLMKYVYRGMGLPEAPYSQSLLNWHAAVVSAGGLGTILRVMTDRNSV